MKREPDLDLLLDLAKLLQKHGPDAFDSLAARVRDPAFSKQVSDILSSLAVAGRQKRSVKRTRKNQQGRGVRSSIAALTEEEPECGALLLEIYEGLQRKLYLPRLRDLKAFAHDHDLPEIAETSRERALNVFVRSLMKMPAPVLRTWLEELQGSAQSESGLEGWSNIILHQSRERE